jgi:histidinol-phosphate aminotransferase
VTAEEFDAFMAEVPRDLLVILDEAYVEFITDPRAVNGRALLHRYPNLVILRTFSKAYGLAGLRVGYAIGPASILNAARSTAIPLSVTAVASVAALASLEAEPELLARAAQLAERRDAAWQALRVQGWNVPEPQGNFLWLPTGMQTTEVAEKLGAAGLVVRPFPPDGIRVSIGEEEAVEILLRNAAEIVRTLPTGHLARQLG